MIQCVFNFPSLQQFFIDGIKGIAAPAARSESDHFHQFQIAEFFTMLNDVPYAARISYGIAATAK
jgi:hypothetical protein